MRVKFEKVLGYLNYELVEEKQMTKRELDNYIQENLDNEIDAGVAEWFFETPERGKWRVSVA